MSTEANIAKAARDVAGELGTIGLNSFDNIARAFEHFADLVDPPTPDETDAQWYAQANDLNRT